MMHHAKQQIALCVRDNVSLATFHLFACIIVANPATFGGLALLAVNDSCRGINITPCNQSACYHQSLIDHIKQATVPQAIEVILNGRERRKILRQHRPLAPCCRNVGNGIPNLPHRMPARTANARSRQQKRCNQTPFSIRAIACIAQKTSVIIRASDFSLGHCRSPRIVNNARNHKPLKSLNIIFGWALSALPICICISRTRHSAAAVLAP